MSAQVGTVDPLISCCAAAALPLLAVARPSFFACISRSQAREQTEVMHRIASHAKPAPSRQVAAAVPIAIVLCTAFWRSFNHHTAVKVSRCAVATITLESSCETGWLISQISQLDGSCRFNMFNI